MRACEPRTEMTRPSEAGCGEVNIERNSLSGFAEFPRLYKGLLQELLNVPGDFEPFSGGDR